MASSRKTHWFHGNANRQGAAALLCALAFIASLAEPCAAEDFLFRGVRVFTGSSTVPAADVLVSNGTITSITALNHTAALSGPPLPGRTLGSTPTIIDGSGRTLLPGLIDTHVHLVTLSAAPTQVAHENFFASLLPQRLQAYLAAGVTTVRSLGDALSIIRPVREALQDGSLPGPDLLFAGPVFTSPGGPPVALVCIGQSWCVDQFIRTEASPAEVQAKVDALALQGVDVIKVVYDNFGGATQLSPLLVSALVSAANSNGLQVAAHTSAFVSHAADLATLGVQSIEHTMVQPLSGSALGNALVASGTTYVTTLANVAATQPGALPTALANVGQLHIDGVSLVLGSDTSGLLPPGDTTIHEVELLVEAGLSPT
ncbi:MAG: imidazolonepropionase-like amidohydrolase, partial [Pseudohongiellaceae bacterium]